MDSAAADLKQRNALPLCPPRESERDQLTRKCEYLDNEIDKLVYGLYGVSAEEIKIIDGK